ncbi:hypothetical protein ABBQ38_011697 [Trebouxia sp. C0009 RCD-2024]
MLRQLAAFCRPLAQQHSLHLVSQSSTAVAVQSKRSFQCTSGAHGLEEFFEAPLAEAEKPRTGKDWKAADLRRKSWDDLHKLWYVLLKERNMLASEQMRRKARGEKLPNPSRTTKVRKSMARIKLVLSERAIAMPDPVQSQAMRAMINS